MNTLLNRLLPRYVVSGVTATAVHFALLVFLAPRIGWLSSSAVGAIAGAVANYWILKLWVFRHRTAQPGNYVALCALSVFFNTLFMAAILKLGVSALPAQVVSSGLVMIFNFTISNNLVFKHAETKLG
ncbi:GtrA family protein [Pseudomonas fluorescens]|uniref:GtrA family protein n=1 Tax=Pseudomonas fluorescens TaxID=294 RepID=UPI001241154A|nr:GtrA family protein [Pseudomonas fluorescens]